jgi:hypothetical protein
MYTGLIMILYLITEICANDPKWRADVTDGNRNCLNCDCVQLSTPAERVLLRNACEKNNQNVLKKCCYSCQGVLIWKNTLSFLFCFFYIGHCRNHFFVNILSTSELLLTSIKNIYTLINYYVLVYIFLLCAVGDMLVITSE